MSKSLIDHAYDYVSEQNGPVNFSKIWEYVKSASGLSEEDAMKRVGQFYTNLMLDGRFVTLGENEWDLRVRQTFDKVHIDMKDVYSDVETSDNDSEDDEEKEYNEIFNEKSDDDSDSDAPKSESDEDAEA